MYYQHDSDVGGHRYGEKVKYVSKPYRKYQEKKKRCNLKKTAKLVKKAFRKVYCSLKQSDPELKPKKFLISYFKENKSKKNFLPKRALKKKLRKALPKQAKKLRKRLRKIK